MKVPQLQIGFSDSEDQGLWGTIVFSCAVSPVVGITL
jgi:hypothetical protein